MDAVAEEKFLAAARKRFEQAEAGEREDRRLAEEDYAFAAGDGQWPEVIERQRLRDGQPCLRINRFPQFIRQITGDARKNKPAIKVHPVDDNSDPQTAQIYEGLIRNIEAQSQATTAYITALDHAVRGGRGHWRITTEYTDDAFDQDCRIRRITNPFAVYWDPNAKLYDKSDAQWCFVAEYMTLEAFEEQWPNESPTDWQVAYRNYNATSWLTYDKVRVCEYWVKEPYKRTIGMLQDGSVVDLTGLNQKDIAMIPLKQVAQGPADVMGQQDTSPMLRKVDSHRVRCYKLSAHAILEQYDWAGKHIPIVSVFGPEEFIGDRVRVTSLIRHSKDPQRMYNYWQSAITEKIALTPKAPFVGTTEQFAGHENEWDAANRVNKSRLTYNYQQGVPPPQRQAPATMNNAEIVQSHQAIDDMKATMGIYDPSVGTPSNETSGRAILARQNQGDTGTFEWIDNLSRSIEYTGRILIDLIPKIYDTERIVRVLGEDGSIQQTPINHVVGGQVINDLTVGKYDIIATVGPDYLTARMEAIDGMRDFVQAFPQAAPLIGDLFAKAQDWPYSEQIADRLKKALPPGMVDPKQLSVEEQQQMAQQQQQAQQDAMIQKNLAYAKERADIDNKVAQARLFESQAAKLGVDADAQAIENQLVQQGLIPAGMTDPNAEAQQSPSAA